MAAFEAWLVFLILVVNVVGELQRKRTLAASRGFLAAARLSCYKKMIENCRRQHCQLRMRNAYFRTANIDGSVKRLRNFCINKNEMVIIREDQMLTKV